jgi:hypothetical protein
LYPLGLILNRHKSFFVDGEEEEDVVDSSISTGEDDDDSES